MSGFGRTLDDAAGEAFDKVAKVLGQATRAARAWISSRGRRRERVLVLRPMINKGGFHFVLRGEDLIAQHVARAAGGRRRDVCAGFQEAVAEVLAVKAVRAARRGGLETVVDWRGRVQRACAAGCRRRRAATGSRWWCRRRRCAPTTRR